MYVILRVIRAAFGLIAAWQLYSMFSVYLSYLDTLGFVTSMAWAMIIIKAFIVIVFGSLFFAVRILINRLYKKKSGGPHPALISPWSL